MKFEKTDGNKKTNKKPYTVTLETYEEVEIVVAAFREVIHRKVESGNLDSISEFDKSIARIEDSEEKVLSLARIEIVTEVLDKFHEETNYAVEEITNLCSTPPYANRDIVERFDLGRSALALSALIKAAAAAPPEDPDAPPEDPEEIIEKFKADLDLGYRPPDNP